MVMLVAYKMTQLMSQLTQVVSGTGVSSHEPTIMPLSLIAHHVGELWHELYHFMWHQLYYMLDK